MSSEWMIVVAAVFAGTLGLMQMIGGGAEALGEQAAGSFSTIPTFGAAPATGAAEPAATTTAEILRD